MQSVTKPKPVPEGYHSVNTYLIVDGALELIEFMKRTFNAQGEETVRGPDGRIAHAELRIGDSVVMVADSTAKYPAVASQVYVYLEDVDKAYLRALDAGGSSVQEPTTQFYGDRNAGVEDPTGNFWWIATRVEEVSQEELERRMKARSLQ